MTTPPHNFDKPVIYLFLFVSLLLSPNYADAASIAEDVNNLVDTAKLTADMFMQDSFDLRLKYQYNNCSLNEPDRQNLYNLTAKASEQLQTIIKVQQSLKSKIENYHGEDWEEKYGSTGLWRKLAADLYVTTLCGCSVDFHRALAAKPDEKNKILLDILAQIDSLDKSVRSPDAKLLKAKTTAQLALTELAYKPSAIHQLNALVAERDEPEIIRFQAAIEKINFLGDAEDNNVDELLKKIADSSCRDNLELVLPLAFLKQKKDPSTFEKIVEKWPNAQNSLAPIVMADVLGKIAKNQDVTQTSIFDAELAVLAAWKNNAQNYAPLLEKLVSAEKFHTPLILYVAGLALTEAAPVKSINLLTQASKLQRTRPNSRLDIEPEKIAEQAAKIAYNLFLSDTSTCSVAIEVFDNYSATAADKADIQLQYLYTLILNQCDQTQRAADLLKKITAAPATGPSEIWHKRATFDLILLTMSQNFTEDDAKNSTIEQLASLIDDCPPDNSELAQLRTEAVTIYCQLLLEANNAASAQKALDILNGSQIDNQPTLILLKSKALLQLGKPSESAKVLLEISDPDYTGFYNHAMELLSQTVEKIDLLQAQEKDFRQTIQTCEKIADLCYSRLNGAQKCQAGLYLAEIILFSDKNKQEKISQAGKLLSGLSGDSEDMHLARCHARLLAQQDKFEQAADLWAKIAKTLESDAPLADRWWQAKFFELDCASKVKKISKKNIAHSIEILQASYRTIPLFWAEKLKLLHQQCLADTNNG